MNEEPLVLEGKRTHQDTYGCSIVRAECRAAFVAAVAEGHSTGWLALQSRLDFALAQDEEKKLLQ